MALGVAVVAVVLLLSDGDKPYQVTGEFESASQLVPGNEVIVGGVAAGSVKEIELGEDGQALVTFTVDDAYAPLRRGTVATVRSYSLSGVANRQVQLTIPPSSEGERRSRSAASSVSPRPSPRSTSTRSSTPSTSRPSPTSSA